MGTTALTPMLRSQLVATLEYEYKIFKITTATPFFEEFLQHLLCIPAAFFTSVSGTKDETRGAERERDTGGMCFFFWNIPVSVASRRPPAHLR